AIDDADLDCSRFERLVEGGRTELAAARLDRAADRLSEALSLWNGPVLADLPDSPARAAPVGPLQQARLGATEQHPSAPLHLGRAAEATPTLHRLVQEHPLRERLWTLLVRAQRAGGDRAAALVTYQRARRVLRDELGLDPGTALQEVHRDVLKDG